MTLFKIFQRIDTVTGVCEECNEDTILVAIVSEFYRCTNCGHDTRQHVNGSIRYLKLDERDKEWLKNQHSSKHIPREIQKENRKTQKKDEQT